MGQGSSKAPSSGQHVFKSETPVRFSPQLVDALQNSPETDSTRAKDLEIHIQNRVHEELARLETEQSKAIKELEEKISAEPDTPPSQSPFGDKTRDLGRESVQREIDDLRRKLEKRKLKEDIVGDRAVEKAKQDVVNCLRINDRRPLDCWSEVEAFKREVGRLESSFLEKLLD